MGKPTLAIVGLDLSLSSTGVARATVGRDQHPDVDRRVEVTRVVSKPPASEVAGRVAVRSKRLRHLAHRITQQCVGADLVLVEGPLYGQRSTGSGHDRAGLWWLVVGRLTGAGLQVVEVPPSVLKTYATGKGNASKDDVLSSVVRRYPTVQFSGNDEADALVLAAIGCRYVEYPLETAMPAGHTKAVRSVDWAGAVL